MASAVSLVMSAGPWSSSVLPLAKVRRAAKSDISWCGCRARRFATTAGEDASATLQKLFFLGQCFYSREFLAFQKFQRRAASGRDVRDFVGYAGGFYGGYG